jgi:hypothetical protein
LITLFLDCDKSTGFDPTPLSGGFAISEKDSERAGDAGEARDESMTS